MALVENAVSTDEAFERVKASTGVTTWKTFEQWRRTHGVVVLRVVDVQELERAIAETGTRWKPGTTV